MRTATKYVLVMYAAAIALLFSLNYLVPQSDTVTDAQMLPIATVFIIVVVLMAVSFGVWYSSRKQPPQ